MYLVPFLIYSALKEWCDLEIWVRSRSRSLKMIPFEGLGTVIYSRSVTMALSCIISEIKRDVAIFSYILHSTPLQGGPRQSIAIPFDMEKLEWCMWLPDDMFSRFDAIPACDGQTDGHATA